MLDLEVVRGPFCPLNHRRGECLRRSAPAASGSEFSCSAGILNVMKGWCVEEPKPKRLTSRLGVFADRHVYAVRARSEKDERSLSHMLRRLAGAL